MYSTFSFFAGFCFGLLGLQFLRGCWALARNCSQLMGLKSQFTLSAAVYFSAFVLVGMSMVLVTVMVIRREIPVPLGVPNPFLQVGALLGILCFAGLPRIDMALEKRAKHSRDRRK